MCMFVLLFFFKQKTAYEMRISDWSSDVCSSDLNRCAVGRSPRTMPAISNTIWSIASFDAVTQAIRIVRHAHARRARLSIDPTSGEARLTVPARGSVKAALRWAKTQRDWIAAQRSCLPERRPFAPGGAIPFGATALVIDWDAGRSRRVARG